MSDSLLDIWSMRKRGRLDSNRHIERVKRAIKENLRDLISESNIISSDGKKKVKIPIRFLDNYRFKHAEDKNQEHVGHSNRGGKPGDIIAREKIGKGGSDKAGDQEGEVIYEEVELQEIIDLMLEELELPWLEHKDSANEIETDNLTFDDISEVGPLSNVDKKRTILENMKRNAKSGSGAIVKKVFPEDLRYKIWDNKKEFQSNAAVYFLMDRSGSMDQDKKYIARAFFFWLAHFCRTKYNNLDLVFIAHDTSAKIVPEENFFSITNSGGTMCSSAFILALEHIKENHDPNKWNNYVFEFSDGDNWGEDSVKCINAVKELLEICTAVGYGEIDSGGFWGTKTNWKMSTLHEDLKKNIDHPRFLTTIIKRKEDVYDCLKQFLKVTDKK